MLKIDIYGFRQVAPVLGCACCKRRGPCDPCRRDGSRAKEKHMGKMTNTISGIEAVHNFTKAAGELQPGMNYSARDPGAGP